MDKTKVFKINKTDVYNAWLQVKKNKGTSGVDNVILEMYEVNLKDNLYTLWNRMSSGTYFPKEVREVKIPKTKKEFRKLGIPTINDRIAQTVVANILNEKVDPTFHENSFGFRPGKSTHQALELTKERCWDKSFVIDFDIKGLFDNIPHELIYKALEQFELERWVILYIKRWLEISDKAQSGKGTPQGGVVSPILANIFMDVCFDKWIEKNYPNIAFARYADDCVVHCVTEKQTLHMQKQIEQRLNKCGIELNKGKTRLANTRAIKSEKVPYVSFDFLGYTFKPAKARNKKTGEPFISFMPTISNKSKRKINTKLKETRVFKFTQLDIKDLAKVLNPKIRGWCNYYGYFSERTMIPTCNLLDNKIAKFMKRKYKIRSHGAAYKLVRKMKKQSPNMFYHWSFVSY